MKIINAIQLSIPTLSDLVILLLLLLYTIEYWLHKWNMYNQAINSNIILTKIIVSCMKTLDFGKWKKLYEFVLYNLLRFFNFNW